MGDDLIDLPVLLQVGMAIAVQDASEYILPYVDWQTRLAGGQELFARSVILYCKHKVKWMS